MPETETNAPLAEAGDFELLQEFVGEESQDAFAILVRRHVDLVYSAALRQTGDSHAAAEVTQAVFVILAKKAAKLRRGTVVPGWLYRTTRFVAGDLLKSERRRRLREHKASIMEALEREETIESEWVHLAPVLDELMARLGGTDRNVLLLRFFKQMSLREIGESLGISEECAKKRSARALEKLRRLFRQRGIVVPAAVLAMNLSARVVEAAPASLTASVSAGAAGAASGPASAMAQEGIRQLALYKAKVAAVACGAVAVTGGMGLSTLPEANPEIAGSYLRYPSTVDRTSLKGSLHYLASTLNAGDVPGFLDGFTGSPDDRSQVLGVMRDAAESVTQHRSDLLASLRQIRSPEQVAPLNFWPAVIKRIEAATETESGDRGFVVLDEGYSLPLERRDGQWRVVVAGNPAAGATPARLLREIQRFDATLVGKQAEVQALGAEVSTDTLRGQVRGIADAWSRNRTLWVEDRFDDGEPGRTGKLDAEWSVDGAYDAFEVTEVDGAESGAALRVNAVAGGAGPMIVLSGVFAGTEGARLGPHPGDQLRLELGFRMTGPRTGRTLVRLGLFNRNGVKAGAAGKGESAPVESAYPAGCGYRIDLDFSRARSWLRKEIGGSAQPVSGADSFVLKRLSESWPAAGGGEWKSLAFTLTRLPDGILLKGELNGSEINSAIDTALPDLIDDREGVVSEFNQVAIGQMWDGGIEVSRVRVEARSASSGRNVLARTALILAGLLLVLFVAAPMHFVGARFRFKLRGY